MSENIEASNILKEVGKEGIDYSNAIPDFSIVSKGEVKIKGMSTDRRINFKKADELLAEELGVGTKEVVKMRKINKLTCYELNDMETMQLVPTIINSKFGHLGGVSEVSKINK
ncbi:MAG: HNH endonuclease [Clostridium sp.]